MDKKLLGCGISQNRKLFNISRQIQNFTKYQSENLSNIIDFVLSKHQQENFNSHLLNSFLSNIT